MKLIIATEQSVFGGIKNMTEWDIYFEKQWNKYSINSIGEK